MGEFTWWQNAIIFILISTLLLSWTNFFDFFDPFVNKMTGGRKLRPYEQTVYEMWRAALTQPERDVLDEQMAQLSFFQRGGGSAKVMFFYKKSSRLQLFDNHEPDCRVATVSLAGPVESPFGSLDARIFIHEGRFFSIEFPKRPKRMAEQRGWTLEQLRPVDLIIHKSVSSVE